MERPLSLIAMILGAAFILLALMYCLTPANGLPSLVPGYDPAVTKVHYKHGVGALIVGLGFLAFAWVSRQRRS